MTEPVQGWLWLAGVGAYCAAVPVKASTLGVLLV